MDNKISGEISAFINKYHLFDGEYYRIKYLPEEQYNYEKLLAHYFEIGASYGYKPHPLINIRYVTEKYNIRENENVLIYFFYHYKHIDTLHPIFDERYYKNKYREELKAYKLTPLLHYFSEGYKNNYQPSVYFDPIYYLVINKDLNININLARHFLVHSIVDWQVAHMSRNPAWWFNLGFYLDKYSIEPYEDVISHYYCEGIDNNYSPNYIFSNISIAGGASLKKRGIERKINNIIKHTEIPNIFSGDYYLQLYPDLRKEEVNPLRHFIAHGYEEKRAHYKPPLLKGVCMVTPDAVGPIKNGGIGTACYNYAISLAKAGIKTTLLFTGPMELNNLRSIQDKYSRYGIYFDMLSRLYDIPTTIHGLSSHLITSIKVCEFLSQNAFSHIIFQDWFANGFWAIREKRLGRKFNNTHISLICHSPTQWQDEGMHYFPVDVWNNSLLRWAEKETIKNVDTVICPSKHMSKWLSEHNYEINGECKILPYTYNFGSEVKQKHVDNKMVNLAFFGRLEKRKGIDIFINAIKKLDSDSIKKIGKISFLGKHAYADGISSITLLDDFKRLVDIDIDIINNFSESEAIKYLIDNNSIAVIPSTLDNLPLVVIESISFGIPLIASNVGGIPEMLSDDQLFECNENSLAEKITKVINNEINFGNYKYSKKDAENNWVNFCAEVNCKNTKKTRVIKSVNIYKNNISPGISVCIPYFNHGKYLQKLINHLNQQTMLPNEIIIVNDGSSDEFSIEAIRNIDNFKSIVKIKVLNTINSGPGPARNHAVKNSNYNYIVFLDADNLPKNDFIKSLYNCIEYSNYDVIYASFDHFDSGDNEDDKDIIKEKYVPLANYLEGSILDNRLGDSCMIIKKSVYQQLGGFDEDRSMHEDWHFGIKLLLKGYNASSLYESLMLYRKSDKSRSTEINKKRYMHYSKILQLFFDAPDDVKNSLLERLVWMNDRYYRNL